ncbi:MAG: MarR family transcriptional regulator [Jatrophihabitans sp.]|nr:MAG: MarR family transcriptional regulator [Jatrophihabitans sp.]
MSSATAIGRAGRGPDDGGDPIEQATEQWLRERPDLDPAPMAVYGRIARIFMLQRKAQASVHEPLGLTHAAFDMLANLRRSGAPHRKTATSLAQSSMISTGGVTFRMDGLEAAGLIRRVRDDNDRRVVYAELTDEGRAVIDRAIEAHLEMEHELLAGLTPRERQTLVKLLGKVESSLVQHEANRSP